MDLLLELDDRAEEPQEANATDAIRSDEAVNALRLGVFTFVLNIDNLSSPSP